MHKAKPAETDAHPLQVAIPCEIKLEKYNYRHATGNVKEHPNRCEIEP